MEGMLHPEDLLCPEVMVKTGRYSRQSSVTVVTFRVNEERSATQEISDVFSREVRITPRQQRPGIQRVILHERRDPSGKPEHLSVKVLLSKEQSAKTDAGGKIIVTGLPWIITTPEVVGILVPGVVLLQETPTSVEVQAAIPVVLHPEEADNDGS